MFIVLEGLDAAGKATQTNLLAERLRNATGYTPVVFSFPRYDTPVGKIIQRHLRGVLSLREEHAIDSSDDRIDGDIIYRRAPAEDALMFQCLMNVDKQDAQGQIRAILAVGGHVICDRWIQSAFCYGVADGIDRDWLRRTQTGLPRADLNIFLDVPPHEAMRRRPEARDRYERDREKQARVRENYERLWEAEDDDAYVTVDGIGTIEAVAERIYAYCVCRGLVVSR